MAGRAAVAMCALWLLGAASSPASVAPRQHGESIAPGSYAASVITVCGLAVMLVVQEFGAKAALFAGEAMRERLHQLDLAPGGGSEHELADLYQPIAASCDLIRTEHRRTRRVLPAADRSR